MELKKIISGIENLKSKGDLEIDIKKIECNSKNVTPNSLFIAIKGYEFDGHEYINEALENGATAIMLDISADFKKIKIPNDITVIIAADTRKALAKASCNFFGNPSKYFKLIGVTGTKGKTTTVAPTTKTQTVTKYRYQWSQLESIDGWERTGETRYVNASSK